MSEIRNPVWSSETNTFVACNNCNECRVNGYPDGCAWQEGVCPNCGDIHDPETTLQLMRGEMDCPSI